MKTKSRGINLTTIVVSLCALVSLFVIFFAFINFPSSQRGVPGPRVFPILISTIMLCASVYSLFTSGYKNRKNTSTQHAMTDSASASSFFTLLVLIILYSVSVAYVGFFPSTVLFLFLLIRKYTRYRWYSIAIFSVLLTLLLYFVFHVLLNVPLRFALGIGG